MGETIKDKVVWITGASSGIGHAMALRFAQLGAQVVATARRVDRLKQTAAECENAGGKCTTEYCDVTSIESVDRCVSNILAKFGRLDVAIANAGFGVTGSFMSITPDLWRKQMETNLFGVIWTLRSAMPHLTKSKGRAAVISSVSGKIATAGSSPYSASKYALVGLCDALYQELEGTGVSITDILPGMVTSEIAQVDNLGVLHPERKDPRPKMLVCKTDKSAKQIVNAIIKRKRQAVITGHGKAFVFLANHLSGPLYYAMAKMGTRNPRAVN